MQSIFKQGYQIDFTEEDTFRDILGFDEVSIAESYTESFKICDLVISTNIYIHLDIVKGSIYRGKPSDIIYSFANDTPFGHLINLKLQFKKEHLLLKKYFSNMNIYFTDQNINPIDFMNSVVTLTFEIKQV